MSAPPRRKKVQKMTSGGKVARNAGDKKQKRYDITKKTVMKGNYSSKLVIPPSIAMQGDRAKVYSPLKGKKRTLARPRREKVEPEQSYETWLADNLHLQIPNGRQGSLKEVLQQIHLFDITIVGVGVDAVGAGLLAAYLSYNVSVWSIDVSRNNIGSGSRKLFDAIATHSVIKSLKIDANGITCGDCESLRNMLLDNTKLQLLSLSRNYISHKGSKYITEGLKGNVVLRHLNLSTQLSNDKAPGIGPDGAKHFSDCLKNGMVLESLDLSSNNIGSKGAEVIADALKSQISTYWGSLQKLDISSNRLGRKGARALAPGLAANKTLVEINLSDNNLGEMMTFEKDPTGIYFICKALKKNATIRVLNLSENNMSNRGATLVSEMLQVNSTLARLSLRNNGIESFAVQAILEKFNSHRSLVHVDLGGNTVPFGQAANKVDQDAWVHPELLRLCKPHGVELVAPPPKGFNLSASIPNNMMIAYGDVPKVAQPQTIDLSKIRIRYHV